MRFTTINLLWIVVITVGCSSGDEAQVSDAGDSADDSETGSGADSDTEEDTASDEDADSGVDASVDDGILVSERFLNIAHRGGRMVGPEETMVTYEKSAELGVDVLEMDLHATSDGIIVCMHDDTVDRTTDGTGAIKNMSFEDLRKLDAGYAYTEDGGATFPYRGQGVVVPTFEEVLTAFPDHPYVVEIKQSSPPIIDGVFEILETTGATDRVILASMDQSVLTKIRNKEPEVYTSFGTTEVVAFVALMPAAESNYTPPARFIHPPAEVVTAAFVNKAKRLDLKVHPWTVNDRATMKRLINLGADGIMTDDPATLMEVVDELDL